MAWRNSKKKVTLSEKLRPAHCVTVIVMAAMPMVFGSTLTLPTFVVFSSLLF